MLFIFIFIQYTYNMKINTQRFAPSTLFILFSFSFSTFDLFLLLFVCCSLPSRRLGDSIFFSIRPIPFLLFTFYFYFYFYFYFPFSFYFDKDFFFVYLWLVLFSLVFFCFYFEFDFFMHVFSTWRFSLPSLSTSFFILVVYIQNLLEGLFFLVEELL